MWNERRPHFLEVFLPSLSSDRLKVPSKFIKHLGGRTCGSVSVTGPSGNSWHVDMIEHNGHLFFDNGWPTFVKDHSIQCGDSLVFRYDGNSHFTIQIFDQSSCEKEEAFFANCSQVQSKSNGTFGKKRERETEAAVCNGFSEKSMRGSWIPVHLDSPAGNREQKFKKFRNEGQELEGDIAHGHDEQSQKFVEQPEQPVILAMPAFENGLALHAAIDSIRKRNVSKVKKASAKKQISESATSTQKKTNISKFIEARAAHYFTSSFPYFVRVIKFSNITKGTLKIPVNFSMAHLPPCRTKITLRNLSGDCWVLNSIPTARLHSTMHTLCGGWLAFVRGNGIKIEDVCIFELVGKLEMRVRILRLGLEATDSETHQGSIASFCGVGSGSLPLQSAEEEPDDTSGTESPKPSETMHEPIVCDNKEQIKSTETINEIKLEAASSIDTVDDATAVKSHVTSASSPISRTCNESTDQLLGCNAEAMISNQTSSKSQADLLARRTVAMQPTAEAVRVAQSFTSPFPSFMKVMMSSNVGGSFTLAVPRKFSGAHLPRHKTDIVLRNVRGDSWNVISSQYGHQTKFCGGWLSFVRENNVKVGDICIFELVDEKVLQVHIFDAGHGCLSNDALADDSTASVDHLQCTVLAET